MMRKLPPVIKVLLIVNVAFFVVTYFTPHMQGRMLTWFALFFPKNQFFGAWQFVTHMFMHGGFAHILLNMYALWAFGSPLELIWGKKRFILFYFLCGLGAGLIYTLVNYFQFDHIYQELVAQGVSISEIQNYLHAPILDESWASNVKKIYHIFNSPSLGASGAIYGVLVAFGFLFPEAKLALIFLPVPISAKYFIPALIALDLFSGVTGFSIFGGGIAHFAHVGGALIGFLLMWYWKQKGIHIRPRR